MNPCIDCRIFMLKKSKAYMEESGAAFIVTGEVLGQRPMSQRRDAMRLIEKEAGLEGLILRPLSAQFLPITLPEREGWIDRDKLLNIQGRSRKPQIKLAEQFNIHDYPCPAGGCLLTDPGFGRRMKDLMDHDLDFSLNDVHLLKIGRHFRLSPKVKLVVGRNEEENQKIETFSREGDIVLKTAHYPGPVSLLRGDIHGTEIEREKAASITARYSKAKGMDQVEVTYRKMEGTANCSLFVSPIAESDLQHRIIE
jgi:tRNA U34 2-thiouridine synthase MnmA/TrmU